MTGLTTDQLKHYKNKGYISPVNALTSSEAKQIRDEIEWMEKYEATKMFPLRETLNYKVLRNDYPTLSAFKNNKIK